ncbi:MAG: lytic murein transglycosylase B [Kangiellaceae bacterium]|jgi:membrane-bound lytic murein transglycosylase B|nr:lytic murein transglycosylase B [Kangiellaceae bacterium]
MTRQGFFRFSHKLLVAVASLLAMSSIAAKSPDNETVEQFIERMVNTHDMDRAQLSDWLSKASKQQKIIDSMNRPAESLPWHKYRKIFVREKRIKAGIDFWNKYQTELKRAEETFQVPASIIVGIIGVETFYGKIQGNLSVLDALYTLGFHYPKRGKFFRGELEQYFLLCREQGWDVFQPKGSYAGAMGMGQFISTSYRSYAVDFDGDGKIDLFDNPVDAIGSVANYFRRHKWRWGEPVAYKVESLGQSPEQFKAKRLKPTSTAKAIKASGFDWSIKTIDEQVASLYSFEQANGLDYWVGFDNFYVITRYNRSPLYAMAVYQFSQEVMARRAESYWQG